MKTLLIYIEIFFTKFALFAKFIPEKMRHFENKKKVLTVLMHNHVELQILVM